jgi:serine/threonine protein kinase
VRATTGLREMSDLRSLGDLTGRDVGRFRVLSRLGMGGMGVVYVAEDRELRRKVALKVLREDAVDDRSRALRFLREARAAASISHPAVATIYEAGETPEGIVYLAMELVDGVSLRAHFASVRLPFSEIVRISIAIAEALDRAHMAGVIHRDLKPDNVMIARDGQVKVLDFGLAKMQPKEAATGHAPTSFATMAGDLLGTPEYMPPEQAKGEAVDGRADLFSLGATMFELLAGTRPFARPTPVAVLAALLTERAPPVRTVRPDTPEWLAILVDSLLASEASARPQTARVVIDALRAGPAQPSTGPRIDALPTLPMPVVRAADVSSAPETRMSPAPALPPRIPKTAQMAATPSVSAPAAAPRPPWIWLLAALAALVVIGSGVIVVALVVLESGVANDAPIAAAPTTPALTPMAEAPRAPVVPFGPGTEIPMGTPPVLAWRAVASGASSIAFRSAAMRPDGQEIAVARSGGALSVVSVADGTERSVDVGGADEIEDVIYAPGGAGLIVVLRRGSSWLVARVDPSRGTLETLAPAAERGRISPDGRELLVLGTDHALSVRAIGSPDVRSLHVAATSLEAARWSSDGIGVFVRGPGHDRDRLVRIPVSGGASIDVLRSDRVDVGSSDVGAVDVGAETIVALGDAPPLAPGTSLWALPSGSGGQARVIGRVDESELEPLAVSSDGRRLLARVTTLATQIRVAALAPGHTIGALTPVTALEHQERQPVFLDASTLVWASGRETGYALFRAPITGGAATPIGQTTGALTMPQVEGPSALLAFETDPTIGRTHARLVRIDPTTGATARVGAERPTIYYPTSRPGPRREAMACARGRCVIATSSDAGVALTDGVGGRAITTVPGDALLYLAVEPREAHQAALCFGSRVVVVNLETGEIVRDQATTGLQTIAWAPGDDGVLATFSRGAHRGILYLEPSGHEHVMLSSETTYFTELAVSPDGRSLAVVAKPYTMQLVIVDLPTL